MLLNTASVFHFDIKCMCNGMFLLSFSLDSIHFFYILLERNWGRKRQMLAAFHQFHYRLLISDNYSWHCRCCCYFFPSRSSFAPPFRFFVLRNWSRFTSWFDCMHTWIDNIVDFFHSIHVFCCCCCSCSAMTKNEKFPNELEQMYKCKVEQRLVSQYDGEWYEKKPVKRYIHPHGWSTSLITLFEWMIYFVAEEEKKTIKNIQSTFTPFKCFMPTVLCFMCFFLCATSTGLYQCRFVWNWDSNKFLFLVKIT